MIFLTVGSICLSVLIVLCLWIVVIGIAVHYFCAYFGRRSYEGKFPFYDWVRRRRLINKEVLQKGIFSLNALEAWVWGMQRELEPLFSSISIGDFFGYEECVEICGQLTNNPDGKCLFCSHPPKDKNQMKK